MIKTKVTLRNPECRTTLLNYTVYSFALYYSQTFPLCSYFFFFFCQSRKHIQHKLLACPTFLTRGLLFFKEVSILRMFPSCPILLLSYIHSHCPSSTIPPVVSAVLLRPNLLSPGFVLPLTITALFSVEITEPKVVLLRVLLDVCECPGVVRWRRIYFPAHCSC